MVIYLLNYSPSLSLSEKFFSEKSSKPHFIIHFILINLFVVFERQKNFLKRQKLLTNEQTGCIKLIRHNLPFV